MECGAWYKRIPVVDALPAAVKSEGDCAVFAKLRCFNGSRKVARLSFGFQGIQKTSDLKTPTPVTVASAKSSKYNYRSVDTPLEPISPAGKFLSGILTNQRHIFQFAVAEQLEELAADRDGANARHRNSLGSNESFLHGRIAEMKEQECQIAIEEVMYMLIVHKFSEIEVPMVPRLCHCISNGKLEILASKSAELESIHDAEVLEIIREHISTVLGIRGKYDISDNWTATRIRRLLLGRIYAASIMYGYFIKSARLRHRLELNLALDQQDLLFGHQVCHPHAETLTHNQSENLVILRRPDMGYPLHQMSGGQGRNAGKLRRYVMGFDPSALQQCAKLKSPEAVNLIERHTGALFGDEENGVVDKVEVMAVTNLSLKRLVLEAVAFGSFLWDVERNVDSLYRLKEN